jgi:hypothetical protein
VSSAVSARCRDEDANSTDERKKDEQNFDGAAGGAHRSGPAGPCERGRGEGDRPRRVRRQERPQDLGLDGAPDPKIGFGRDGYDPSTKIAPLAGNKGQQVYGVPPTVDTSAYNEVWVWCEKYAVPLGVAKLK